MAHRTWGCMMDCANQGGAVGWIMGAKVGLQSGSCGPRWIMLAKVGM